MVTPSGSDWSIPSQYTPPSLVSATFVNMVFLMIVAIALGLVLAEVPGATPKKPFSGLMALRFPTTRVNTQIRNVKVRCTGFMTFLTFVHPEDL